LKLEINIMKARVKENKGITLVIVLVVMAILLSVIGAGLLFSGVNTKITTNYQTGARAFYAADAGLSEAVSRLSADTTAVAAMTLNGDIHGDGKLTYRGGGRTTPAPVAQYVGTQIVAGNTIGSGTPTNNETGGYAYYKYQLNVTGIYHAGGVELAGRTVGAQALFGPVIQ
jgi:Tfp pilus assembly protein PilX